MMLAPHLNTFFCVLLRYNELVHVSTVLPNFCLDYSVPLRLQGDNSCELQLRYGRMNVAMTHHLHNQLGQAKSVQSLGQN
jgi:hypothetical protein